MLVQCISMVLQNNYTPAIIAQVIGTASHLSTAPIRTAFV